MDSGEACIPGTVGVLEAMGVSILEFSNPRASCVIPLAKEHAAQMSP